MDTVQWLKKTSFHYQWPQFSHIYVELSNVLHISESSNQIVFDMEFALLPKHQSAIAVAGERYTFRKGNFTFETISSHSWREKDEDFFTSSRACTNKGIIMYLGLDPDGYLIYGDFGYLRVKCASVDVHIAATDTTETKGWMRAQQKL